MSKGTLDPSIESLLRGWLPTRRWFPVKSPEFDLERVGGFALPEPGGADAVEVLLLAVTYKTADGGPRTDVVQVPLSFHGQPLADAPEALIGEVTQPGGGLRLVYDAAFDEAFIKGWLELMRAESTAGEGAARGHLAAGRLTLPDNPTSVKVLSGEQSNTSVIVDDGDSASIVKIFRVLAAGKNPEVELGAALTAAETGEVPATLGWITGSWHAQGEAAGGELTVAHEFLRGGQDAWRLAVEAAGSGTDFTAEAHGLGAATATVHARLAGTFGTFPGQEKGPAIIATLARRVRASWAEAATAVGPYDQRLEELLATLDDNAVGQLQRVHGDLHLGQILRVPEAGGKPGRWAILDFEGEPLRTIDERNMPDLPLRDVVGMLRSFDYAAGAAIRENAEAAVPDSWVDDCAEAFLAGYAEVNPGAIDRSSPLFVALWLDKALYEVVYELRNRPDWLAIPVNAARHILDNTDRGTPAATAEGNDMTGSARTERPRVPRQVDAETLARVAAGAHHAPHSVLGAHLDDHGHVTVRSVKHLAKSVTVVTEAGRTPMEHEAHGVWVAVLEPLQPGHVPDYRLEVEYDADSVTVDDPYHYLPTVGEVDLHLIGEGRHERLWDVLGAHIQNYRTSLGDVHGVSFAVWAPNAQAVRVIGDFNGWDGRQHALRSLGSSGVWEVFIPGVVAGACYKFEILTRSGHWVEKADPLAFGTEVPPLTASRVVDSSYRFKDSEWMAARAAKDPHNSPMSVYEVHLGSWRLGLGYKELAKELVDYVKWLGFTHVEFMPVAEHPFGGSWGYQVTSYFAPTSRFGHPDEFRFLVDSLHQAGIGVLLDWVPAHFPKDSWALAQFDGQPLYEHSDPALGEHPDWGTLIFDFGRREVRNFLVANALYWLDEFHIDGLRVDAVASMIYLDYSREEGQWRPNKFGGRENLEAISFMQEVNATVYKTHPGAVTIAEESTAFPGVTAPTNHGGLGFGLKWNMGWMHDSLKYIAEDPINRQWHHGTITFSLVYAFSENFLLPISHDEVVHGKGSMLRKMPGDRWQQLANLRAFFAYQWAHPGKQLIFMGTEFGQEAEWSEQYGLDWFLADIPAHRGLQLLIKDLNELYAATPALHVQDNDPAGFQWINGGDAQHNVLSFIRYDREGKAVVCAVNFSGAPHQDYVLGVPSAGEWTEVVNTDAESYGGSGVVNNGVLEATTPGADGQPAALKVTLPPLGASWFMVAE
ncbi:MULTISPECIES: 1,4-alpha-glucan branching enzyme [Paenarthrobacter]|uniref:1,4-alpha-glucan branching enzyme GlgB n=1 Tax=Paenarthrobacter ureafaciens TaxID=37931 RepID=A0AAX3EK67_PAEUR|nr:MULTISPECIES: 1,4-alpha-glucan branching enzyme [Paenarthrobacter]NKR13472.1 1,4-alpha-glucan branching enzyme [Arthrobacter sp. M5]NKR17209.1 1,4-alpha-glucan branching enzyme [Arthrobacter sp. M6]OEH61886.1 1,4-alpha-glucan branching enzyme [Arthrobacter sp. D4]OEH64188.1 1,4-alpha-glucan branching enzyme [Arthrobacter sp. D2]MDO5874590.1 1,4-alpha-glucan branching enzyme [Paenarthrobacter sp. SD-1]